MDYSDNGSDHDFPPSQVEYPDIDEAFQYPWQGAQSSGAGGSSGAPAIDPRLYQGLFANGASDHQITYGNADDHSSVDGEGSHRITYQGDPSEDSYEYSGASSA